MKFYSWVTQIFSGSGGGSCNGGGPGAQQWGGDLDQGPHRHEGLPGQPRGHSRHHRWDPLFISKHHFAGKAVFSLSSGLGSKHFHWRFTHSSAENPPIYAKRRHSISPLVSNTSGMVPNEFQAFYPVVRIRIESPPPSHPQESVWSLPLGLRGETRLRGRGWGDPIPTMGQTLWYTLGIHNSFYGVDVHVRYYSPLPEMNDTFWDETCAFCFSFRSPFLLRNFRYFSFRNFSSLF